MKSKFTRNNDFSTLQDRVNADSPLGQSSRNDKKNSGKEYLLTAS
jgi:hypothetical protein